VTSIWQTDNGSVLIETQLYFDFNGQEVAQYSTFLFDLAEGEITKVQTTGIPGPDILFGLGSNDLIIPVGFAASDSFQDFVFLPTDADIAGKETIVIRLSDLEIGARTSVYGFDPEEDEIALWDDFLTVGSTLTVTSVTVSDLSDFTISSELINTGALNLFAVGTDSGTDSILFATNGTEGAAVAEFVGLSNTQLASASVTVFNEADLLETL